VFIYMRCWHHRKYARPPSQ